MIAALIAGAGVLLVLLTVWAGCAAGARANRKARREFEAIARHLLEQQPGKKPELRLIRGGRR